MIANADIVNATGSTPVDSTAANEINSSNSSSNQAMPGPNPPTDAPVDLFPSLAILFSLQEFSFNKILSTLVNLLVDDSLHHLKTGALWTTLRLHGIVMEAFSLRHQAEHHLNIHSQVKPTMLKTTKPMILSTG
jgi:hypothetical protein